MPEILKEIDCTGLTERGEPVMRAYVERNHYGTIGIHIQTRYSSGGKSPFKTVYDAEYAIHASFDGFVPVLDDLQKEAVALLQAYGPFVKTKEREAIEYYTSFETRDGRYFKGPIIKAMDSIKARSTATLATVPAHTAVGDSEFSDAQVTAGVRYLTSKDADHASTANKVGWNARHSPLGHWACAMLDTHPTEAIAIARGFIGGYAKQLRKGGVL